MIIKDPNEARDRFLAHHRACVARIESSRVVVRDRVFNVDRYPNAHTVALTVSDPDRFVIVHKSEVS